jgi:hypothetical protein
MAERGCSPPMIAQLATSPGMLAAMTQHNRQTPPDFGWPEVLDRCTSLYAQAGATVVAEHIPEPRTGDDTEGSTERSAEGSIEGRLEQSTEGSSEPVTGWMSETARHA